MKTKGDRVISELKSLRNFGEVAVSLLEEKIVLRELSSLHKRPREQQQ
ncbi:MAG: hypothetical protein ACLFV6_03945 [Spirulinaceae cyanobacterium]